MQETDRYFQVDLEHAEQAYRLIIPRGRILVAEDDRLIADILRYVLTEEGYQVDVAHDGMEAFKLASRKRYDLVSMDLGMPNCDGYGAIAAIDHSVPGLPIIVVSGRLNNNTVTDLRLHKGVKGFLDKPVDMERYLELVTDITSSRKGSKA